MNIFNVITLFGGLAMFLYGMRMMGDGLKESSSGSLKTAMEKLTNTPVKAFLLGMLITAMIQSSKATIVITAGLVGAGIISLHQSIGIMIGANVGTTVTGQIIRLLDLNASGTSILQFFKPSTLAPLAMIAGIILIMGFKFKDSDKLGRIIIGFGILFSGLMNMTGAVDSLSDSAMVTNLLSSFGDNPLIAFITGGAVAFVLQSQSATVGILQAFSTSGQITFGGIYVVLLGIYLGDSVTTGIVCYIGAKPDAKRAAIVNIIFNIGKVLLIIAGVTIIHKLGLLDTIWNASLNSGGIADVNTIFNLVCAIILLPTMGICEKLSYKIVKDEPKVAGKYDEKLAALNPVFFSTPAIAFSNCYDILLVMYQMARTNINRAFEVITKYDEKLIQQIEEDENYIDTMTDRISNYLIQISARITTSEHVEIMNHYYKVVGEFEHLGDHAVTLTEIATVLHESDASFSEDALAELMVVRELLDTILDYTSEAFIKHDLVSARRVEPLEEVVDDMVNVLRDNHLKRLREGICSITAGTEFLNTLTELERISDVCSNIGVATVARVEPKIEHQVHEYISRLHSGRDEEFNREYQEAHDRYFRLLK